VAKLPRKTALRRGIKKLDRHGERCVAARRCPPGHTPQDSGLERVKLEWEGKENLGKKTKKRET